MTGAGGEQMAWATEPLTAGEHGRYADLAGRPLIRKEVWALRAAGTPHGAGTVGKALADRTAAGELVNRICPVKARLASSGRL